MPGAAIDREHVTSVTEARCGIGDIAPGVERMRTPAGAFGEGPR
jgi:hypothetical protein